jgi:hypothetical protein
VGELRRGLRLGRRGHRQPGELLSLHRALDVLGDDGLMGQWRDEVPVADIVGTATEHRARDFDGSFRLRNRALSERWRLVECAMASGRPLPPVDLVLLGEVYFVRDGHHRISVACALGRTEVLARVQRICTVAFAMACLRPADLVAKAAERRFLARVPLPVHVRCGLWLADPADWARLADAAEAWGFRQSLQNRRLTDRRELAQTWWSEEVLPVVAALRANGAPPDAREVQLYVGSLASRGPTDVTG